MYKHLFFDLDHTLWDFDRNSTESIFELYEVFRLSEAGIASADEFNRHFIAINNQLWSDFYNNRLTHTDIRKYRFRMVMDAVGVSDHSVCDQMNEAYLQLLPRKPHLMESASDVLDYLKERYQLHIITNGFDEIQALKMASSGLTDYFQHIVTIQKAEAKKPEPRIFEFALNVSGASLGESLMIGDNYEADVCGALNAGMDVVYYNTASLPIEGAAPTYEIQHLKELMAIL
ncbi:YjjG family noncanonical pyrimidine nucleotidase [Larkinella humicola]|uniref:Noncanonical pyrimidine nucleotidase, YjjG family n=1 Tax=Larkinella humicola TaxID=2607654 RepID=A0A5N1JHN0_9BACT|nr:YjjG family noncanonical pyrimidine nucleotidase [Larkinella humicola]KAA9355224.1 noncanonical pyrimidine nucleotidase, YjjG family [Larkinella humicola]